MRRFAIGVVVVLLAGLAPAQEELEREKAELRRLEAELAKRRDELARRAAAHQALRAEGAAGEARRRHEEVRKLATGAVADRYRQLAELRLRHGLAGLDLGEERGARVKELAGGYLEGITGLWKETRMLGEKLKATIEKDAPEPEIRELLDRLYAVEKERWTLEAKFREELRGVLKPREEARFLLAVLDFDLDVKRGLDALRPGSGAAEPARDVLRELERFARKVREGLTGPEAMENYEKLRRAAEEGMTQLQRVKEEEMVRLHKALEELERRKQPALEELERRKVELREMMERLRVELEEANRAVEEAMRRHKEAEERKAREEKPAAERGVAD